MSRKSWFAHERICYLDSFPFIKFLQNYDLFMFDVIQLHVIVKMCSIVVCEIVTTVEHLGELANKMLSFINKLQTGKRFQTFISNF